MKLLNKIKGWMRKLKLLPPEPEPVVVPATGTLYRAVDTDFGNNPIPSQAWFDELKKQGYDGFITTLHTNWNGVPQVWHPASMALRLALNAGLWIGAYGRPVTHYREALGSLPPTLRAQLKFYALDVEPEENSNFFILRDIIDSVKGLGVRPIIYTGYGMWQDVTGGHTDYAKEPLWEFAGDRLDWPALITEAPMYEFGGWNKEGTTRIGQQVQMENPAVFEGISVDRNVFTKEFIDAG